MELLKVVSEVSEKSKPEVNNFKDIKPETDITPKETKGFWDKLFNEMESEGNPEADNSKEKLEKTLSDYFQDLKDKSEMPDTFPDNPFEASDLEKISPEANAKMREEFADNKQDLIKQWEDKNGCSWPTYKDDVWITNKHGDPVLVRQAGAKYDAHHIQPLGMGGKNEVSNLTPLSADIHYDHRGVHAIGSPYDKLDKLLGGIGQ